LFFRNPIIKLAGLITSSWLDFNTKKKALVNWQDHFIHQQIIALLGDPANVGW
jgi:hypothetical protein